MILEELAFLALAAIAVGTALAALLVRELVHTILWVSVFFVSLSGLYFLLSAPFLGVLQLGVYAGAVTILLLFGVMVTRKRIFAREAATGIGPFPLALALLAIVVLSVVAASLPQQQTVVRVVRRDPPLDLALQPRRSVARPPRVRHAERPRGRDLPRPGGPRMTELSVASLLFLSGTLLAVGLFGILTRRNFILLLIAVEIAMNAAILNFVYFAAFSGTPAVSRARRSPSSSSASPRPRSRSASPSCSP